MEINFGVTGTDRKAFVKAVSELAGWEPVYKGAPTFAYAVNNYIIDKDGTLFYDASVDSEELYRLLTGLAERGFTFGSPDRLVIEFPKEGLTATAIANLEKLVISKAALIKKAIGVDSLPIEQTDETLRFPWFAFGASADEVNAYSRFIGALCAMAKEQKRVTAKEKPVDNEKYAFRCFLLRLGFIGAEYKAERKILLSKLSGNGSFKSGERRQEDETVPAEETEVSEETHLEDNACETGSDDLAEALADAELIHGVNALIADNDEEETV